MPTLLGGSPTRSSQPIRMRLKDGLPVIDDTYEYTVIADYPNQNKMEILQTQGLPLLGITPAPHGFGICTGKSATVWPNKATYWTVSVDFSTDVQQGSDNPDPATPPEQWVPIYETKKMRLQENVTKDASGTRIANSAGQPFEVGLTRPRYLPVWEFYQFEPASVSDETIVDRMETVNDATFKGRAVHTLLLTVESSQIGYFYGQLRRYSLYRLVYNSKTWKHKRLDVGTVYKSGSDLLAYTDTSGNVILGGLNGSGAKQTVGTAPAELEFEVYDEIDFTAFLRI